MDKAEGENALATAAISANLAVEQPPKHKRSLGDMDWANEPATWKQFNSLKRFGCKPDHPMTKTEAAALLISFGVRPETPATISEVTLSDPGKHEARRLRETVENSKRAVAEADPGQIEQSKQNLALALTKRREFWADTCRDAGRVLIASMQVHDLYQKHGCRFFEPSLQDVQYILNALDSAAPDWHTDHPELFFQTLDLNF